MTFEKYLKTAILLIMQTTPRIVSFDKSITTSFVTIIICKNVTDRKSKYLG